MRLRGVSWGVAGVGHWGPPTAAAWGRSGPGSCLHAAAAPSPAGAGASELGRACPPPPAALRGGRRAGGLPCLSHSVVGMQGPGMSSPAPSSSPCASRGTSSGWGDGHPSRWPEQQRWPLARRAALGSPSCGPCPALPAGTSAGEGSQAGTATQWWGIKGRKGRRKKNTPRHRQLTELARGWGHVGTAAGLACQPGTGRAAGGGHPFSAPVTHPYGLGEPVRGNNHPLLSTRGTTTAPLCLRHD